MSFLNTKGKDEETPEKLQRFLKYVGGNLPPEDEDEYTRHLDELIRKIKMDGEWKGKYMLLELTMKEQYREGVKDGMEKGQELGRLMNLVEQCLKKIRKGKSCAEIAEELETEEALITLICREAEKEENAGDPEKTAKKLVDQLSKGMNV